MGVCSSSKKNKKKKEISKQNEHNKDVQIKKNEKKVKGEAYEKFESDSNILLKNDREDQPNENKKILLTQED